MKIIKTESESLNFKPERKSAWTPTITTTTGTGRISLTIRTIRPGKMRTISRTAITRTTGTTKTATTRTETTRTAITGTTRTVSLNK
jgi:hypothetical protein